MEFTRINFSNIHILTMFSYIRRRFICSTESGSTPGYREINYHQTIRSAFSIILIFKYLITSCLYYIFVFCFIYLENFVKMEMEVSVQASKINNNYFSRTKIDVTLPTATLIDYNYNNKYHFYIF